MTKRKRREQRVPEVLWRIYCKRVHTLADTVVKLLPQPPPSSSTKVCQCKGKQCLLCCRDAASFLLRPDDPSDYKKLLTKSYAVVSDNAPPLALYFGRHWSQQQIVKRTIEMIMRDTQMSRNVICNGYDKCTQSSKVVDLLTSSAWKLFHKRIGDHFMVHLLKFIAIFLPLPHESHHQVSGFPISDLCSKFSKNVTASAFQQSLHSLANHEPPQKRKRVNDGSNFNLGADMFSQHLPGSNSSVVSVNCHVDDIRRNHTEKCHRNSQMTISEVNMPGSCISVDNNSTEEGCGFLESLSGGNVNTEKHARPPKWQRHKKRRKLSFAEVSDKCFCFWMLHASRKVPSAAKIKRNSLFYRTYCSSLFPRNHILNASKANNTGAISVLKDIFGLCDKEWIFSLLSYQNCHFCLKGSQCLFHTILRLIKHLIRKSRDCHYKKLMDKHCKILTYKPIPREEAEYVGEGSALCTKLPDNGVIGFQEECIWPTEKSKSSDDRLQQNCCYENLRLHGHQSKLSDAFCLKSQVVSFVWAVCRSIVPLELLGHPSNWKPLRRNIAKFVHLRKFENFSLKQCMDGLKISSVPFLSNKISSCYLNNHALQTVENTRNGCQNFGDTIALLKEKLFSCWVYWFFSDIVVPILQANFYVTDVEDGKLEVFYFRKPFWKKLSSKGVACLREHNYHLLSERSLLDILKRRSFGFSRVRFLPKGNGVRVLANLKASSKLNVPVHASVQQFSYKGHFRRMQRNPERVYNFKPVNDVLRDLSAVLKGLKLKHPENLGTSVFDYNDVYKKLSPFILSLKSGSLSMPSVYVVICDISKAFDFVNQDKLLSVMNDVMLDDEYLLESSSEVICTKRSLWVHRHRLLTDQSMSKDAMQSSKYVPFYVLHHVWINQVKSRTFGKAELYYHLREHVKRNVLQLDQNFYLQAVGIPQGSTVSSLLCSYYYAHLEKNVIFPFLKKVQEHRTAECHRHNLSGQFVCQDNDATIIGAEPNSSTSPKHVLVRFIDDILFISTSQEQAASFFTRLQRGFRDYNCSINEEKSCMNFDMVSGSGGSSNKMYTGDDGISFLPWSGLLINSCTLEIQADYTRYLNIHLSATLTVSQQDKPGCYLKEKLCHYMQPKCHPIFYDSNINSAPVVRLNIYQAFLLSSMKFHCYVCNLSNICTLPAKQYFEMIMNSLRYTYGLIKSRMYSRNFGTKDRPVLKLKKKEVVWLGLKAYIRVLKRKQPRHSHLLSLLRTELLRFEVVESASLKYAIEDSHSSLFWKIKY